MVDPGNNEPKNTDTKLGDSLGLTGTPWFVVNGKALGSSAPASLDGWKQIIAAIK